MDHGQGHGTTFKQVLSEKLGIDADKIRYRHGDSDLVTIGIGTFGSRSAQLAGSAVVTAADRLIDKGRKIAAHTMEAAANDIVFEAGRFTIAGTDRGVGQALLENLVYDPESGQLVTGSFQDYGMPRADDFCRFELEENSSPTDKNPLGVKGVGEAGTIGAIPAVMNAVNDALAAIGAPPVELPATAEKLWRAIRAGS